MSKTKRIVIEGFVWCDYHGEVHGDEHPDYYDEGPDMEGKIECCPANWRKVYRWAALGEDT